jgi:hypothetical protein
MRSGFLVLGTILAAACGCSSVGSSAVRTGPAAMPPYAGPVGVYAATQPTQGTELGVVEVHGANAEGGIEDLVPLFVKRVAQLGGNAAVIDAVSAHFEIVAHPYSETYTYPCGWGAVCVGTRVYAVNDEVMVVTVRGRAFSVPGGAR